CQRLLAGERGVERCLHGGLNLRSGVPSRSCSNSIQIELRRAPIPPRQLQREDLLSLRLVRQVDKEQFIEPAFANQFGRKCGDVLHVAATKTGALRSCIQERNAARRREETPAS